MTKKNKIAYFFISIIFFVLFDLYFSDLILNNLRFNYVENPLLDLIYVQNTGAAFSILEDCSWFLIAFSLVASVLIVYYAVKYVDKFSMFACYWASMLVAGVGCNLYERIAFGYVRDFFKLKFVEFPVFNISDIFICVSVFAIIFMIVKNKYIKR